ncbi:MAG: hypothetical protein MUE40_14885 [Anaerolineae bacterium]|jgi:hypothetical protein|nr:hypothetical protein [Anaerolineae bacterium]
MIYKVSYVEETGQYPGGIKNEPAPPRIGDRVQIGPRLFQVVAVEEILPPRENFLYLQVTVQVIDGD